MSTGAPGAHKRALGPLLLELQAVAISLTPVLGTEFRPSGEAAVHLNAEPPLQPLPLDAITREDIISHV